MANIRIAIIGEDHVTAEIAPQPTSIVSNFIPKFSTIAFAAGPKFDESRLMTSFIPIKPIAIVNPERNALDKGTLKIRPITVIIIGNRTVGPAFNNVSNTPYKKFVFYLSFYF